MAVLNTTSPIDRPGAPTDTPSNTVPSSRTRIAVWVTGFAYAGLQKPAGAGGSRSGSGGVRRAGMIPAGPGKGKAAAQGRGRWLGLVRPGPRGRGEREREHRVRADACRPAGGRG